MLRITTREYKLILSPDRFADRQAGAAEFQRLIHFFAGKLDAKVEDQNQEEERRTYYLDTPSLDLGRAGFALRVRFESAEKQFKVTLKHRSPDRYLAASKDVRSSRPKDDEVKFEEDILPPFRGVFSQSNALWFGKSPGFKEFGDTVALFPGLDGLAPKKTGIEKVNGFEAHEIFCKLCRIKLGNKQKLNVGLSFWYNTRKDRWPLVAECAFDCSADKGDDFPPEVFDGANRLFDLLQKQSGWFNLGATTKTAYAYEGL